MTERDSRVVVHVGKSRQLTQEQIGLLEFPYHGKKNREYSYQMCQKRIREFYIPNKLLQKPKYIDLEGNGNVTPIYRLGSEGKALYEHLTGEKAKMNRVSFKYTPHLIETNKIVVNLKREGIIKENFELESSIGGKRADLKLNLEEFEVCIEVDLSGKDWKKEIQRQFEEYQMAEFEGRLIYYSKRWEKLREWITEIYEGYIDLYWCEKIKDIITVAS